jgi:hypothetical protein
VGHRACVLGELARAQHNDVLDALDGPRVHVGRELLRRRIEGESLARNLGQ